MAQPFPWGMVLVLAAIGGCTAPSDPEADGGDGGSSISTTRLTDTDLPDGARAVLDGTLVALGAGSVANVSAYNPGPETFGISKTYTCVSSGHGAWQASLSGPPGDDLHYASPSATTQYSCPGFTGQPMAPGTYANWTFHGNWTAGTCEVREVCDNWWDGDLTLDGERVRAPAGDYMWRFTFTYSVGGSGGPGRLESETIGFPVQVPPAD